MSLLRRPAPDRGTTPAVLPGFHLETVLVQDYDTATLDRFHALTENALTAGMAGVVGHAPGDPEVSYTGPLTSIADAPAVSIASIGSGNRAIAMPTPQAGDTSPATIAGDPVMAALMRRSDER